MKNKIEQIAMNYTFAQQREVFAEECAEAIKAAMKISRATNSEKELTEALDEFAGEVADVLIMAQQMRFFLGADRVDAEIERKVERQLKRIEEEKV